MKKLVAALCLTLSSFAFAYPSAEQMQENFSTCASTHESWHRRFGVYVVSFELSEAYNICRARGGNDFHLVPRAASCRVDGKTLYAGFYCEETGR